MNLPQSLKNERLNARDSLDYSVERVHRLIGHILVEIDLNKRLTDSIELRELRNSLYNAIYKYEK